VLHWYNHAGVTKHEQYNTHSHNIWLCITVSRCRHINNKVTDPTYRDVYNYSILKTNQITLAYQNFVLKSHKFVIIHSWYFILQSIRPLQNDKQKQQLHQNCNSKHYVDLWTDRWLVYVLRRAAWYIVITFVPCVASLLSWQPFYAWLWDMRFSRRATPDSTSLFTNPAAYPHGM
jgi:hypothetical protein